MIQHKTQTNNTDLSIFNVILSLTLVRNCHAIFSNDSKGYILWMIKPLSV